ncbi:carbohydrate kinase family protein [Phycicoccus sp. 3266]|uniref:carbohydrate kinase family protein n=1 Tax=Phycicoccus sp. 3266 TaxID=2817751 RepID=UPI00285BE6E9|nr:carbohydrate kinase family protein [Phycicoccus sp. 3266]MDR6863646.1 argininosuccinate lyase [Phycicoccus sp. 3266]
MTQTIHVIGNVQLDVLASPVTALPSPGGDTIIDQIDVRTAGAAGNVSRALHALGAQHRLFGAVGDDDAGRWVAAHLHQLGLGQDLHVVPGEATGISIALEAPDRERAFLTAHGVLNGYTRRDVPDEACHADLVLFTGYFSLPGLRGEGTKELLREAAESGATTFFDTGWDPGEWAGEGVKEILDLLPQVHVFLPNEPEALALTGESTAEAALAALVKEGPGWVVVKLGERGLLAGGPDGQNIRIPAPKVDPLDTTGAGDSLAAGVLAELARGADMRDALGTGIRVASTVVGRPSRNRYPGWEELLPT